jgi:hypothetical protein
LKARRRFFLKKEAKTFATLGTGCRYAPNKIAKVFWFFFSKKNRFLPDKPKAWNQ